MTESKGKNTRKKNKTPSEKAGAAGVKLSAPGAAAVLKLAKKLFTEYPKQHREIGIRRPSSRVAVDYLLMQAKLNGDKCMEGIDIGKNLFHSMGINTQEE